MPTYDSNMGEWHAAIENIVLTNKSEKPIEYKGKEYKKGQSFIYEGPDRAALQEFFRIDKEGTVHTMGQKFTDDVEFLNRIRQNGHKDMNAYLKHIGFDREKTEKDFKKRQGTINAHELPEQIKGIESLGSGVDTSGGGQDRYGGFGPTPNA